MNATTARTVAEIKERGWYPSTQTLGEGGWQALADTTKHWKRYELYFGDDIDPIDAIVAKDDVTAIKLFQSEYNWDGVDYQIVEKIVTYRTVKESP